MNAPTPWSVHAWPPLLWQAGRSAQLHWRHVGTCVTQPGSHDAGSAGQTLWAGTGDSGEAGVAWDWVQIASDVVAMADPMSVVSNLRLVGNGGEVLTALQSARFLNEIVHALPWQHEVQRALHAA
ncbi:MAG: hypothetical protein J0L57_00880 [Burkholderiales bacterium]|nr:hypothetical protein [Burkholderiales bacterium]